MFRRDLLTQIERNAHDPTSDLATLLRQCITLGGVTGSESLREWASRELIGYANSDELPDYRNAAAPLLLDAHVPGGRISGQQVPYDLIPDFARADLGNDELKFPQPIAEIAEMLSNARRNGENAVNLGVPLGAGVVAFMNEELRKGTQPQVVERIYWQVSLVPLTRILDVVRTMLVALVAEMRAGTPSGVRVPTRDVAEQAAEVVIHGMGHRIVIQQNSPGATATIGDASESRTRRIAYWVVAVATVVAAVAAVIVMF